MTIQVGLDSQCLSYIIDIMGSTSRLSEKVATEQLALIRIYLYTEGTFWVTPQVANECKRIGSEEYRELHESFMGVIFGALSIGNMSQVQKRSTEFFEHHTNLGDCLVLAEAEDVELDHLITFDTRLIERLSVRSDRVNLSSPSSYWKSLGIAKGSVPIIAPHSSNPLSQQDFWHW
jgi:hypothetical protein